MASELEPILKHFPPSPKLAKYGVELSPEEETEVPGYGTANVNREPLTQAQFNELMCMLIGEKLDHLLRAPSFTFFVQRYFRGDAGPWAGATHYSIDGRGRRIKYSSDEFRKMQLATLLAPEEVSQDELRLMDGQRHSYYAQNRAIISFCEIFVRIDPRLVGSNETLIKVLSQRASFFEAIKIEPLLLFSGRFQEIFRKHGPYSQELGHELGDALTSYANRKSDKRENVLRRILILLQAIEPRVTDLNDTHLYELCVERGYIAEDTAKSTVTNCRRAIWGKTLTKKSENR